MNLYFFNFRWRHWLAGGDTSPVAVERVLSSVGERYPVVFLVVRASIIFITSTGDYKQADDRLQRDR